MQSFFALPRRRFRGKVRFITLALVAFLSACRMPIVIQGEGFIFGAESSAIYQDGYVLEINEDFQQTFWPVPAPSHYFESWNAICKGGDFLECPLELTEEAWGQDREVPLDATFLPGYAGPLQLIDYQYFWNELSRTLTIPVDSIQLIGGDPSAALRAFVAPPGMSLVVAGRRVGDNFEFQLPVSQYTADEFWLFLSTLDEEGTLATVGSEFGNDDYMNPVTDFKPHSKNSPWTNVLVGCATANDVHSLCSMETLPYVGAVTDSPTLQDVMHRVVVSHGWMGQRFANVLKQLPPEMLKMFRGVTAIVIGSEVRPSFFTPLTSAIHIDPQDLWLTPAERNTIDWEPDFRSGFGAALNFIPASTYLAGSNYAWYSSSSYPEGYTRGMSDIIWPLGYVLIHELAHANDYIHPAITPDASGTRTPLDYYFLLNGQDASTSLANTYPLNSDLLYRVGNVLFQGAEASADILSLSGDAIGNEFAADSANAFYAYSNIYEDTASLVEEVLMRYFFGLNKMQAFVDVPISAEPVCTEYTVRWGSVNRAAVPQIKERARLVLSTILGEADVSKYLDAVPEQTKLQTGIGLCESLPLLSAGPLQDTRLAGQYRDLKNFPRRMANHERAHKEHRSLQARRKAVEERHQR
ncbi:hypothetical protein EY643_19335 [Halioglobus maricola]|uniref:Uncharacterized protein n=1 Tax=Halioglobus maricola TaxID=2601894 RepID=A0A5P9NP51_9GAMM|nr:hypothetical protein [Halioglobus maricola]QFU77653.1 hypothetical protein EY643_19335 [Halioglobus maricola]